MRIRPGRPDLGRYREFFDAPESAGAFGVTFLGVSSLYIRDGESAVLTDRFFSRPALRQVALRRLAPDRGRIEAALRRAGIDCLDAVAPVHTHFDHAMDSAVVAERTGALLVGGRSASMIGRGHGLPEAHVEVVTSGASRTFGAFRLTWVASGHCPPDRFPGPILRPVTPPAKADAYRCGDAWSILVEHRSGRTGLIQGSAGFVGGALDGRRADVAYLGVGQLGRQDATYIRTYWAETVEAVGARQVVLIHWDDFFRPLDRPLRALPYAGDDLDATMRVLVPLAERTGVRLHLPALWRSEDPWSAPA